MKYFISISVIISFISCTIKQFDENTPYALEIKEVRSIFKAEDIIKRTNNFGINSYIVAEKKDDGIWYRILCGAEKNLENIEKYKKTILKKISLNDLRIINFQNLEGNIIENYAQKKKEIKKVKTSKPGLPEKIFDVINKFPDDNNFIVKKFFIINSPDSVKDLKKFRTAYKLKHDLPRGIYLKSLMKKSECIAEVIYEDNLFNDQVTIDIIKLKKQHNIKLDNKNTASFFPNSENQLKIADYFAELILETGKYSFEDKVKISVSSFQKFNGYKVTIKPSKRKEVYRTYFILVSEDLNYVVFSQSTEKTEKEINTIFKTFGKSDGLNSYMEFYNTFYKLPVNLTDDFICFTTEKITSKYARERRNADWAKKIVGHWNSTAHFYSDKRRSYVVSFFDLLIENQVDYIYKTLYIDAQSKSSKSFEVNVNDKIGISFKGKYPVELSYPSGRHIIVTANLNYGKLKLDDLVEVCESIQLDENSEI